jgi:hypothetical protein
VRIDRLDHLVLTVADIDRTLTFYEQVLGMPRRACVPPAGSGPSLSPARDTSPLSRILVLTKTVNAMIRRSGAIQ